MGLLKTVIGGAIGFMVGGPLGAAGGAILANSFDNSKYDIMCPHCKKKLGVDEYGRYECCHCHESLIFDGNGVIKDPNISVICPYCETKLLIEGAGNWTCAECKKEFTYGNEENGEEEENFFLFLIFAMFAKVAKANGVIKREHISILEEIISDDFEFSGEERKEVIEYFRRAKDSNTNFEEYCINLNDMLKEADDKQMASNIKEGIIENLFKICSAGGEINSEQNRLINFTISLFNIEEYIIEGIRGRYESSSNIDKYYEVLGCKKGDSFDVIRSKYKKLVMEYHPDKIASINLPEYLKEHSKQKFQEVQEAFDNIKKYYQ